jgi:hypothetical protein
MNTIQNLRTGTWQTPSKKNHKARTWGPSSKTGYISIHLGKRVVGKVKGDVFIKSVKASKHFLHFPPAIAFDVDSLRQAGEAGEHSVRVIDTESRRVYLSPISTIWAKGIEVDRGYGRQIALPLEFWSRGDRQSTKQLHLWR